VNKKILIVSLMIFIFLIVIILIINCGCLDENGNDKKSKKNHAPTINNMSIAEEDWPNSYQISWNVTDEDEDNLIINLYFSYDNQSTWKHLNTFEINEGKTWWNFPDTGKKETFFIKINVSDGKLESEEISKSIIAKPIIKYYEYSIEIIPEESGWNLIFLPVIQLDNNSLSSINEKLDLENIGLIETLYGTALRINTSNRILISGKLNLSKLDSEYISSHGFSMYNCYPFNISANPINTNEFPDEFKSYNRKVGKVWLYYNNSKGFGNISIKLKFDHRSIGEINYAIWGKVSIGWQEKEVYEEVIVV
jgi:hypothetical protein